MATHSFAAKSPVTELTRLLPLQGNSVELQGNFGKDCKQCEVIINYGKGFYYAYRPQRWQQKKLVVTLKDLGKALQVKILVRTASGDSATKPFKIKAKLITPKMASRTLPAARIDNKNSFAENHDDAFGGKGLDQFKVDSRPAACNKSTGAFHQARIIIHKKRFGDSRIENKPVSGCSSCQPLSVRWYHEPTGSISYQLHIQRRQVEGICSAQVRRK